MKFHTTKTTLENLTGEINATNTKQFEKNLFLNTYFFFYYPGYPLVAKIFYKSLVDGAQADSMTRIA